MMIELELKHYLSEAERVNKIAKLIELADYAEDRMKTQKQNIQTTTFFDFKSTDYWVRRLESTKAARNRILRAFKNEVEKLNQSLC